MSEEASLSATSARPKTTLLRPSSRGRRLRMTVVHGTGADHMSIYYFLKTVFEGLARREFRASLEDPFYEPNDRLLVRRGNRIVGHVQVTHRVMQFGPLQIPVAGLSDLAVSPEWRGRGIGDRLLEAAEEHMLRSGALVGLMRTRVPHFFRRSGWALCGRHCHSRADARAVLSDLLDRGIRRRRRGLHIRPWRYWERAALARIYDQNVGQAHGPLLRTDAYWQWLVGRKAYDQIHVALEGPGLLDLDESRTRIVGYAITRGEQIVELFAEPKRRKTAAELLARACADAIEHDRQGVLLHAPPANSLHHVFKRAGGTRYRGRADQGEVYMARLSAPMKLLGLLAEEFHRRGEAAELSVPSELGLLVDGKKYRIALTRRTARIVSRRLPKDYLRMNVADFTRLVLGQLDWSAAMDEGRLNASTARAKKMGRILLPHLPLWHPPLDNLRAGFV
ncbi:MAG: GNAT family N-acetyltransferase [Thermoguttaceae bacterium]